MRRQIRSFGIGQTAKVAGVIYFITTAIVALPAAAIFGATSAAAPPGAALPPGWLILLAPIFYGIIGFIGAAIACVVYNLVAGWVGGIEIELRAPAPAAPEPAAPNGPVG